MCLDREHKIQLHTALCLFGCKSVAERLYFYSNDKSVFMGEKSNKGDGKYTIGKFATFDFQLRYKKAKTDSETRVQKCKEKVWSTREPPKPRAGTRSVGKENDTRAKIAQLPTRIAALENFPTYCKGLGFHLATMSICPCLCNELPSGRSTHLETCFCQAQLLFALFCFFLYPVLLTICAILTHSNTAELPGSVGSRSSVVTKPPRGWIISGNEEQQQHLYGHQKEKLKDTNTQKVFKCFSFIV